MTSPKHRSSPTNPARRRLVILVGSIIAVIVIAVGAVVALGGGGDEPTLTEETAPEATAAPDPVAPGDEEPTPTAAPTGPVEPLTGLPISDESLLEKPALMVKIDNSPPARPQIGLNQADQGIELLVEGITRLALVFHSTDSDPVGPIRSGRSSDPDLASNYGTPLFAWSGGNPTVRGEVRQGEVDGKLYDVGFDQFSADYFRDNGRGVAYEHTLFASTGLLFAHAPEELGPPPQLFAYRDAADGLPADAEGVPGVEIVWRGGVVVDWVWDEATQGWLRFQAGTPHVDGDGVQVAPPNVVLFTTAYGTSAAFSGSPQALTVGSGEALVLTAGSAIPGLWERGSSLESWSLTSVDGGEIGLTPGHTWIGLPEDGDVSILSQERAEELLALAP